MRFLHVSDLHFGKTVGGVPMLESDQPFWVDRFLELVDETRPQAVLIAGDVYDRSAPSGAAVTLLSRLLVGLADRGVDVLLVPGNHDSAERLSFARELLSRQRIHIAGALARELTRVRLADDDGPVDFWLMPYVFPAAAAQALGDDTIRDYDTAVRRLLAEQPVDPAVRSVLVAHQNVTACGAEMARGGSESAVGGVGQVEYTAFDAFDYTALGHIHASCPVGRDAVRYAGTPMCYHFNETRQGPKGPLLVELGAKGTPPRIERLTIPPLHPMRELRGPFAALRDAELARRTEGEYLRLVLTDQPLTPEVCDFFQSLAAARGSVLMERDSEFRRAAPGLSGAPGIEALREKTAEALFADFFTERSGAEPDEAELLLLREAGELLRSHPPEPGQDDAPLARRLLDYALRQEARR